MGAGLPGHDLAGNQIACRLVGDELAHELDIETLQRLESLPADCLGTMLLVSRDRDRLNDVATGTLVVEDDGLVKEQQASHDGDLRQRPTEPACQSGPNPDDPGSKAAAVPREQSRKLSVNERHEPDSMPGRIEQLEKNGVADSPALGIASGVAAGAGLPGRTEILKSRRGVWICHLGPFRVRASDACSRSTRCEDGSQLARRQPPRKPDRVEVPSICWACGSLDF